MKRSGGVSGAVSLVMIFCILCLVIFSVLTLAAADREYRLSEMTARNAAEYYRADYEATLIAAALRRGESQPGVSWDGDMAFFTLPVGDTLELNVELSVRGGACEILRWRTVYPDDLWLPDDSLNVWDGTW